MGINALVFYYIAVIDTMLDKADMPKMSISQNLKFAQNFQSWFLALVE